MPGAAMKDGNLLCLSLKLSCRFAIGFQPRMRACELRPRHSLLATILATKPEEKSDKQNGFRELVRKAAKEIDIFDSADDVFTISAGSLQHLVKIFNAVNIRNLVQSVMQYFMNVPYISTTYALVNDLKS